MSEENGVIHGYARCSTNEEKQDIERQIRELKRQGAEKIWLEYEHGLFLSVLQLVSGRRAQYYRDGAAHAAVTAYGLSLHQCSWKRRREGVAYYGNFVVFTKKLWGWLGFELLVPQRGL